MLKIVSYNLRSVWDGDGVNCFPNRAGGILEKINAEKPDVICFQEGIEPSMAFLRKYLKPEYDIVYNQRNADFGGEGLAVAVRTETVTLLGVDFFWLSETPFVPASRYEEQSDCPRASTELVLMEYATGKVFRVLNTHLDHVGAGARKLGLRQILKYLDNVQLFPEVPVMLMGDFNAWPDGEEMQVFDEFPGYTSAAANLGITYHGYMNTTHPECIDYIYIRGAVKRVDAYKWTDEENGVFLSDHYPVCAILELE